MKNVRTFGVMSAARLCLLVAFAVSAACKASVPSGVFSCANGRKCPPGQICGRDLICVTDGSFERDAETNTEPATNPDADSGAHDAEIDGPSAGTGGNGGSPAPNDGGGTSGGGAGSGGTDSGGTGGHAEPMKEPFRVVETNVSAETPVLEDLTAALRVRFSAELATASISSSSVSVLRDGVVVAGTLETSPAEVTWKPEQPYSLATSYELRLTNAVRDRDDRQLAPFSLTFATRDGRWTREMRAAGSGPQIAVAGDGHGLLVYSKPTDVYPETWVVRFTPPTTWSEPMLLKPGNGGVVAGPIAFSRRHHAAVSFYSISSNLLLTGYTNGPTWLADAYLAQTVQNAKLLLNEQDEVFAVMSQPDFTGSNSGTRIVGFRFTLGAVSPTLIDITGYSTHNQKPSIALLDGEPHVLWQRAAVGGGDSEILAGRLWSSQGDRLSAAGLSAAESSLIADPLQSSLIAVWEQSDATWTNIWAARIPRGGAWSEAKRISDDLGSATSVALALDSRGRALAAWRQAGGIASASFAPATGWSAAKRISAAEATNADAPRVAVDAAGNGIVAWTQDGASDSLNEVWVARYLNDHGWQDAQRARVSDQEAGTDDLITLGADDYGRAFVMWTQSLQVWSARFD